MNDSVNKENVKSVCGLAAWGVVRISWGEIARWRKDPEMNGRFHSGPHLKLADEQTVVAMAALAQAAGRLPEPTVFQDWGVLAAPRYFGRPRLAQAIARYKKLGPRGISPLVIPMLSQHTIAGTLALILGCHGPVFGVSSGSTQAAEALLASLVILENQPVSGVWAVLSAWSPEPTPDGTGQILGPSVGVAVALALTSTAATGGIRLVFSEHSPPPLPMDSLLKLADFLEQGGPSEVWRLPAADELMLEIAPLGFHQEIPQRRAA